MFGNCSILKHFTEQAKLGAYLRAQQNSEQSTTDWQSGPCKQMGSPQLKLDTNSPTTLNDTNITEETPMTSNVQTEPWDLMESPQLKYETTSLMTSYDAHGTRKTPMTSFV